MTYPYSSTDTAVTGFIAGQNSNRGGTAPFSPAVVNNGIAGTSTDNVTGFSTLTTSSTSTIAMGTGFNTVIIDGYNSASAAGTGAPDNFSFTVDPTGLVTLTDTVTGKSEQLSGVSFLIFDGAAHGTDVNGNIDYQQMYFIGGTNQTAITELYNAAFGRQPDLGGVEYYMNQLAGGVTFQQIATEFMTSPEFQSRFGSNISDTQFVTDLYQNVLHRAASATEIEYYVAALANNEAGSIVNTANPLAWTREQELLNFTTSPENQADTAGFVINTASTPSNGLVYSTPGAGSETGAQAIAIAQQTGNLDTTGISAGNAVTDSGIIPTSVGSISIAAPAYSGVGAADANEVLDYGLSGTVTLSPTVPNYYGAEDNSTVVVNGSSGGGSYIGMSSGTVNLFGNGNYMSSEQNKPQPAATPVYVTVTGWNSSDHLILSSTAGRTNETFTFLSPAATSPLHGGGTIGTVVNVGKVGSGTPAEVAAAASKVYVPSDTAGEAAIFFGQTTNGGTAVYDWFNFTTAPNGADTHNDHTVHADNFAGGVILVGVAPSSITASTFHS